MAKVWIVMVVLFAANVFADEDIIENCDECIRSGKTWCKKLSKEMTHCFSTSRDENCPGSDVDPMTQYKLVNENGLQIKPMHVETTIYLSDISPRPLTLSYASTVKRNISIVILSTYAHEHKIIVKEGKTKCTSECNVEIVAKISPDFCVYHNYVDVGILIDGIDEKATFRYNVPCACQCTKETEFRSDKCTYNGNYTCGICTCENEWTGEKCENTCNRGDTDQECMSDKNGELVVCHGNGKCVCSKCKCSRSGEGSQYFDASEQCSDICTQTIKHHACFLNGTLENCKDITILTEYSADELDDQNRKVWVHCKEREGDCVFDYYAMNEDGYRVVMNNKTCDSAGIAGAINAGGSAGATSSKVPLILGILAAVALVAGVAGVLLWKHMSSIPASPMSKPGYEHMGAEDCTGENPLYIPPTSSFKNPTYGKC